MRALRQVNKVSIVKVLRQLASAEHETTSEQVCKISPSVIMMPTQTTMAQLHLGFARSQYCFAGKLGVH